MGASFQSYFVGNLLVLLLTMKGLARLLVTTNIPRSWWVTPKLVPHSLGRTPPMVDLLIRQMLFFLLAIVTWWGLSFMPEHAGEYVAFPLVWFTTEWLGATFVLMLGTRGLPLIHRDPWLAHSLTDFWSARWNLWVASWLKLVARKLLPRGAAAQLWGGFLLSGVFHELMFALPFHLATGRRTYGGMTLYFLLQALGVSLERRWLRTQQRGLKRLWAWSWIILPIPLFTHGAFLSLFRGVVP